VSHSKLTVNERLIKHIEQQHIAINAALGNEQITRDRVTLLETEVARILEKLGMEPTLPEVTVPFSQTEDLTVQE